MILHIPHASTNTLGLLFKADLNREIELLTDHYTDEIFNCAGSKKLVFPVSRLVCDVERFENDSDEPMSKLGMGVCYTLTTNGKALRHVSPEEREFILARYYRPHHQRLTELVHCELDNTDKAIIVDCHSFPSSPLPCDMCQRYPRPDICIGTDSFHTPDDLIQLTKSYFENLGHTVAINSPYTGTIVPLSYLHKDRRVKSIMIEINRDLYSNSIIQISHIIEAYLDSVKSYHDY